MFTPQEEKAAKGFEASWISFVGSQRGATVPQAQGTSGKVWRDVQLTQVEGATGIDLVEARDATQHRNCTRQPPPQRMTRPQTSVVLTPTGPNLVCAGVSSPYGHTRSLGREKPWSVATQPRLDGRAEKGVQRTVSAPQV